MRDWFDSLEPRERLMVGAGAACLALALLYFAVWSPLDSSRTRLADSVATWERALADLRPLKQAVRAAGSSRPAAVNPGQSLVVIVDSTVSAHDLSGALRRSQPSGPGGIRVEFEDAAFDDLVRWLGELGRRYGMRVDSGNFSSPTRDVPGRVNASLTLAR